MGGGSVVASSSSNRRWSLRIPWPCISATPSQNAITRLRATSWRWSTSVIRTGAPYLWLGRRSASCAGGPLKRTLGRSKKTLGLVDRRHHILPLRAEEGLGEAAHPIFSAANRLDEGLELGRCRAELSLSGPPFAHQSNLSAGFGAVIGVGSLAPWRGSVMTCAPSPAITPRKSM